MISRGNEVCHIDSSVVVVMAMSVLVSVSVTVDAVAAVVADDRIVDGPTVVVVDDDDGDVMMMIVLGSSWSWSGSASSSSVFSSSNRVCSDFTNDGRSINDDMDGDDTVELLLITAVE